MKPRELIASACVPGHTAKIHCYHHDGSFTFWLDRIELMSSRVHESEEALAQLALESLGSPKAQRVLVGGLGMGFTLARVLKLVDAKADVEVVELVPEVVQWNRDLLGHFAGHPLADARTRVTVGDVQAAIAAAQGNLDVILLDVDNGPEALTRPANDGLYNVHGLAAARAALRPGGVLAIWSAAEAPPFTRRLQHVGFRVEEHHLRARGLKGPRRTIWVAVRPAAKGSR